MTQTFGEKVIDFNRNLMYSDELPENFRVINPYLDNPETYCSKIERRKLVKRELL